MIYKKLILAIFCILFLGKLSAQTVKVDEHSFYKDRISKAPQSVFEKFIEAGMQPTNHELTETEKVKVGKAFAILPPLYKKVLKEHLQSISFMDNMPNTALTSTLETTGSSKQFNITFRAGILNETISEWATWKEKSAFDNSANPTTEIQIDAGKLDAIQYVLLHEATHVVDAVLGFTPHAVEADSLVAHTEFTRNIWRLFNKPTAQFTNPTLEKTRFRSGKIQPITSASEIYNTLKTTPFTSLYGMASWYEDAAELISIYHLTQKMKQPFTVFVKEKEKVISRFEPMTNAFVKQRAKKLNFLYVK